MIMTTCANCGQLILFGGVKHGTSTYCNQQCFEATSPLRMLLNLVPDDAVESALTEIHQGECPCCGGPGPVDMHFSYRVMSFLAVTRYQTIPKISCSSCAAKAKIGNFFVTLLLGLWGPFGFLITPVYLYKNFHAWVFPPAVDVPSEHLREYIRFNLAQQIATQVAEKKDDSPFL